MTISVSTRPGLDDDLVRIVNVIPRSEKSRIIRDALRLGFSELKKDRLRSLPSALAQELVKFDSCIDGSSDPDQCDS